MQVAHSAKLISRQIHIVVVGLKVSRFIIIILYDDSIIWLLGTIKFRYDYAVCKFYLQFLGLLAKANVTSPPLGPQQYGQQHDNFWCCLIIWRPARWIKNVIYIHCRDVNYLSNREHFGVQMSHVAHFVLAIGRTYSVMAWQSVA